MTAVALVAAATPAVAQKVPDRIAITPASAEGAILIRVPVMPFTYTLDFSKNGNDGFMSRVYLMKVEGGASGYRYIARTLKPGRYQLNSVWQQGSWGACLAQGTFTIEVVAGRVLWVGTFETGELLARLQGNAVEAGKTVVQSPSVNLFANGDVRPILIGRDDEGLAAAKAFAAATMSKATASVELAQVTDTAFEAGAGNRSIGICG
ncbi:hypothetical protein [Sphingomonas sp.]|uniref:hypothetical protein n=1 Tax=Sphingomonas sp. TaxID=28214 RepID=UPI001B2C2D3A|nr:hypothetical protein [Sphingomonas sp.]MBO9711992.1 hypothetical protein [Sphingomonas sp.]